LRGGGVLFRHAASLSGMSQLTVVFRSSGKSVTRLKVLSSPPTRALLTKWAPNASTASDTKLRTSSAASKTGGASPRATTSLPANSCRYLDDWHALLDQAMRPDLIIASVVVGVITPTIPTVESKTTSEST